MALQPLFIKGWKQLSACQMASCTSDGYNAYVFISDFSSYLYSRRITKAESLTI